MFREAPAARRKPSRRGSIRVKPTGYEFVYPHDQALKIAKAMHTSVLTAKGEVTGTTMADGYDTYRRERSRAVGRRTAEGLGQASGDHEHGDLDHHGVDDDGRRRAGDTTAVGDDNDDHCRDDDDSGGSPGPSAEPRTAGADDGAGHPAAGDGGPPANDDPARNDDYRTDAGRHVRPDRKPASQVAKDGEPAPAVRAVQRLSIAGGFALRALRKARA
jgi:hypothetical protein